MPARGRARASSRDSRAVAWVTRARKVRPVGLHQLVQPQLLPSESDVCKGIGSRGQDLPSLAHASGIARPPRCVTQQQAHSPERVLNAPSSPLFANAPQKLYELARSYEMDKVPEKEKRVLRELGPDEMHAFGTHARQGPSAARTGWSAARGEVTKLCGKLK